MVVFYANPLFFRQLITIFPAMLHMKMTEVPETQ